MMDENNPQINPVDSCINILNVLLASLTIFERNVKIAHWDYQSSIDFIQVHKFLDEIHEDVCESIDDVAEEIRKADRFPNATLSQCIENSTISQINSSIPCTKIETFAMLSSNLDELRRLADGLSTFADENKFWTVQDLANTILRKMSHHMYFVKNSMTSDN